MSPIRFTESPEKPLNKTAPVAEFMTAEKSDENDGEELNTDRDGGFTQATTDRGFTFQKPPPERR